MSDKTEPDEFVELSTAAPGQDFPAEDLDGELQEEDGEQFGTERYEPGDYSGGRERLNR